MMPDHTAAFAPGRVNLIGEHTDYNDGLALPFALNAGVTVRASASHDDTIDAHALDLDATDTYQLGGEGPSPGGWRAFVRGATAELAAAGLPVRGATLEISGTVARGSGLSSSAALEVALCLALLALADADVCRRGRSPGSARAWRTSGSAPRPGCLTISPRCAGARTRR